MFVNCAGCGKRFRGEAGNKKYKCTGCGNLFTFPKNPHSAPAGSILCSYCWTSFAAPKTEKPCPACGQNLAPRHGGRAEEPRAVDLLALMKTAPQPPEGAARAPRAEAAAIAKTEKALTETRAHESGILETRVTKLVKGLEAERKAKEAIFHDLRALAEIRQELEKRVFELENALRGERTRTGVAVRERDEAQARARQGEAQLAEFRTMALTALEPLHKEFARGMGALLADMNDLTAQVLRLRKTLENLADSVPAKASLANGLDRLQAGLARLDTHLRDTHSDVGRRMEEVLGIQEDGKPAREGTEPKNQQAAGG